MTIENLVEQVRVSTNYQTNKCILKEKIQTDLHFVYNGGLFKATQELVAFLSAWEEQDIVLEDTYQNPILINRLELLTLAKQHYQMIMNRWHVQHEELKRVRKI